MDDETVGTDGTDDTASDVRTLVPARERVVDFYGDPIPVAQMADNEVYVPLRPLTDFLGLDASGQRQRVQRDRVLSLRIKTVAFTGADGREREMLCLPLDALPGWLFSVSTMRVRADLVEKLDRYRAECFRVLWQAFRSEIVPEAPPRTDLTPAQQALEIAEAVVTLARQQVAHEAQLTQLAAEHQDIRTRQQIMADYLRDYIQKNQLYQTQTDQRLTTLEVHMSAGGLSARPRQRS